MAIRQLLTLRILAALLLPALVGFGRLNLENWSENGSKVRAAARGLGYSFQINQV